ncbi:hypothetical protein SAMN05192558_101227 [Actinokineospora alba]|uniref:DUF4375 domain-containing protein n=1 Tax=Actinokineospora alba TaxID=504798 RepID=A0A1H0F4W0_9PSEU|nr:hypothetical protein [Actinokineospora alba]TDP69337.1 hypothetical protein C8E96_4923 [Actinokineospora alba]SDI18968.1 hypothetical protein SAMN05421871_103643 [Actinokineospora alba]SDN89569.1 hypothetical protein SAMN05192558_101227 [Actinokineospora alba]
MEDLDRVIAASWHADTPTAHAWFTLLCQVQAEAAEAGNYGLGDLAARLAELDGSGHHRVAIEDLLMVLGYVSNPWELLSVAGRHGPDELTTHYEVLLSRAYAAEQAEDPDTWNAYLSANGPAWDGTERHWKGFRDRFARGAAQAGVGNAAATFLSYVEGSADKVAAFAQYGLSVSPAAPAPDDGELADLAAELAELDDKQLAALAAEIAAELGEHQDH